MELNALNIDKDVKKLSDELTREQFAAVIVPLADAYARHYLEAQMQLMIKKAPRAHIPFREFIKDSAYEEQKRILDEQAAHLGTSLEKLVHAHLTPNQREVFGDLIYCREQSPLIKKLKSEGAASSSGDSLLDEQSMLLAQYIGSNLECQEIAAFITGLPSKKLQERLAGKFAEIFHQKLESGVRVRLKKESLTLYFLNMGIILIQRPSYKRQFQLQVAYPSVFKDEQELAYHIAKRYVDATLFNVRPEKTAETIRALRKELFAAEKELEQ